MKFRPSNKLNYASYMTLGLALWDSLSSRMKNISSIPFAYQRNSTFVEDSLQINLFLKKQTQFFAPFRQKTAICKFKSQLKPILT